MCDLRFSEGPDNPRYPLLHNRFDLNISTIDSGRFRPNLGHIRRIIVDRLRASGVLAGVSGVAVEVAKTEHSHC